MMSDSLTFGNCIQWCDACPYISSGHEMTASDEANASSVSRLFEFFSERLRASDNSIVAYHILEILSVFALQENDILLEKVIELSWISLHTIYVHAGAGVDHGSLPYALAESTRRFGLNATSSELQSLQRVVAQTSTKLCHHGKDKINGLTHLKEGMLRHWGLVTASLTCFSRQRNQLSSMIAELAYLLESLDNSAGSKHEEEKKESEACTPRRSKLAQSPSIIGLEAATFPDYFEMIIHIVVAVTATLNPGLLVDSGYSPYHHLQESFGLFRRLIELYQSHIAIFPRKSASAISNVSKDMLSVAVSQLQRCVDWRNAQPLLSVQEREALKHDPGSIKFLQQLLDAVSSHTAGTVLTLCDLWQSREGAHVRLSRSTALRFAAEKAARRIMDVSSSHNLEPPSLGAAYGTFKSDDSLPLTKGFHQIEAVEGTDKKRRICPMPVNSQQRDPRHLRLDDDSLCSEEAEDDSEDSFGAAGDWGDDSDDEDPETNVNLHSKTKLL
jgi:hypothetical protein